MVYIDPLFLIIGRNCLSSRGNDLPHEPNTLYIYLQNIFVLKRMLSKLQLIFSFQADAYFNHHKTSKLFTCSN